VRPSLDVPFSIFGQGLGALIVFELTRALRREGLPQPTRLFLAEQHAPQLPKLDSDIHELDEPAFREELRRRLLIPQEVFEHQELMELVSPILRADFTLAETYTFVAEEPLDVRFVIFGSDDVESWREQTSASTVIEPSPARMLDTIGRELAVG
jgi:surfactin synthase thioesterase subunit